MPLDTINTGSQTHVTQLWFEPARFPTLGAGKVHVWLLDMLAAESKATTSYLSNDELTRAAGFKFDLHRCQFILCRSALRSLLGRYLDTDPSEVVIGTGTNGKRYVSGELAGLIKFNV